MKQNKNRLWPNLYLIGVTGGVGAGKSTVLSVLRDRYHAYVIQADEVGRRLRQPGEKNYLWMAERYGAGILNPDRTINPAAVSEIIFHDPQKLKEINEYTHPVIRETILEEIGAYEKSLPEGKKGLAVLEAALLREGRLSELCDEIWYVRAPREVRIARLIKSRGYSRERCEEIMSRQAKEEEFIREADIVIDNGGTPKETGEQIAFLLRQEKRNRAGISGQ